VDGGPSAAFLINQHKKLLLVSRAGMMFTPWRSDILTLTIEQLNHEMHLNQQQKCDNLKR